MQKRMVRGRKKKGVAFVIAVMLCMAMTLVAFAAGTGETDGGAGSGTPEGGETATVTVTWDANANGDTVTNEANETVTTGTLELTVGSAYEGLPTLTREGYTFVEWCEDAEGITAVGEAVTEDVTAVYAKWEQKRYTLTLDADGGNVTQTSLEVAHGDTWADKKTDDPTREKCTFAGWYYDKDSVETKVTDDYVFTGDVTFKAKWKVTHELRPVEGTCDVTAIEGVIGEQYGTLPTPTKDGNTFLGWYFHIINDTTGEPEQIPVTEDTVVSADKAGVPLYAHWEKEKYTLTLEAEGGNVTQTSLEVVYGDTWADKKVVDPAKEGYTFAGWYAQENTEGTETEVTETEVTDTYVFSGNVTFKAHWTANTYTLTLDYNNGATAGTQQVEHDMTLTEAQIAAPVWGECTFAGWYYDKDGVETEVPEEYVFTGDVIFKAKWKVTHELKTVGGTCEETTVERFVGEPYGDLPVPTKEGYNFTGWYFHILNETTGSLDEIPVTNATEVLANKAGLSLYAHWELKKYTLTLNADGGNGSPAEQEVTHGNVWSGMTITAPMKEGYTFDKWYYTKEDGTEAEVPADYVFTEDVTFKAHWTINKYTLTLDADGGNGSPAEQEVTHGNVWSEITITAPTKEGYTFDKWYYTKEDGTEAEVPADYVFTEDVIFKAHWTINKYTLTLNADGGNGSPAEQKVTHGDAWSGMTITAPTKAGYTFTGWYYTNEEGVETEVPTDYVFTGDVTFKAHWTINKYTLTLDADGGNGSPAEQEVTHGDAWSGMTITAPTKEGYTFDKWYYTNEEGMETEVPADYVFTGDVTFKAHWTINKYTLTLNADGGNGSPAEQEVTHGNVWSGITIAAPTKEGYTFAGWYYTNEEGMETEVPADYVFTEDVTFKVHWTINKYTLTLNADGGNGSPAEQEVTHGDAWSGMTITAPTKAGYTFTGWYYTNEEGVETEVPADYVFTGEVTFKAYWTANEYTFTLDADGGSVSSEPQKVIYGEEMPEIAAPTKEGYTFAGWYYTKEDGTEAEVPDTYTFAKDMTFKAHWEPKEYNVTFANNDGTNASTPSKADYNGKYTIPKDAPTRAGYTFAGWFTAPTGGTQVTADSIHNMDKDCTFYAHWIPVKKDDDPKPTPKPDDEEKTLDTVKNVKIKRFSKDAAKTSITWSKVKDAQWYTVEWSTKKTSGFKPITKKTKKTKVSWKVKTRGKTYYIRVTAYRKDGSKTIKSEETKVYIYKCVPKKLKIKKMTIGDQYRAYWSTPKKGIKEKADGLEIQQKTGSKWKKYAETQQLAKCWKYDFGSRNAKGKTFRIATYFKVGKKRAYSTWTTVKF